MIPLKLMTRSVSRATASVLSSHTSFHTAAVSISKRPIIPRHTTSAVVVGFNPLLKSHQMLPYSTEASPSTSKPVIEESLEPGSQSQLQPPPPTSSSVPTENSSEIEPIEIKKGTQKGSVPSSREEGENAGEKILSDKLYKSIEIEVLSYEPGVLDSYQWFVLTAATHLGISVGKCWSPLKSDKSRFPLLKSAFVHKKHQVHYEIRTYHRFLTFHKLTGSTADTFLEYIERNIPEGVGMKVTRVEVQPLPEYLKKQ